MALENLMTYQQFVQMIATAQQAASSPILDFTTGSINLAQVESNADVGTWVQSLFIQLLATTRASTSSGSDLDTFVGDFGITRLPATVATGYVTFSRFSATQQAVIYPGATVQSADGTQNYTVGTDAGNTLWDATVMGYVVPVGTASATVPVTAVTAGTAANVSAGIISVITTPIPNIDTVTNAVAITNGVDEEADTTLRTRFVAYIASLSKGTKSAIEYAITSLQSGITENVVENYQTNGDYKPGFFYAVVNDGTGSPSSTLLDEVYAAVDAVRGLTIQFAVVPPTTQNVSVSFTVTADLGYNAAAVKSSAQTAVTNYINGLSVGAGLSYSKITQVAYASSPGVLNVTSVLVNSGTADIAGVANTILRASSVTVS